MKVSIDNIRKDVPRSGQSVVALAWNTDSCAPPSLWLMGLPKRVEIIQRCKTTNHSRSGLFMLCDVLTLDNQK